MIASDCNTKNGYAKLSLSGGVQCTLVHYNALHIENQIITVLKKRQETYDELQTKSSAAAEKPRDASFH